LNRLLYTSERSSLASIPELAGCYLFKNKQGYVIYVGKSKNLRSRVKQYFYLGQSGLPALPGSQESPLSGKLANLVRQVHEIEIMTTDTEINALILECQLIKEHKPRYNSQMMNTPIYQHLHFHELQEYPAISISDSVQVEAGSSHGSFYDAFDAQEAIELIGDIWQTPTCARAAFSADDKPCLNYHLGKCCGPCSKRLPAEDYRQKIAEIIGCLNGDADTVMARLKCELAASSAQRNYEQAARIRDNIRGLQSLARKYRLLHAYFVSDECFLYVRARNEQCYSLFHIEDGVTQGRIDFPDTSEPDAGKLGSFIAASLKTGGSAKSKATPGNASCLLEIRAVKYFVPIPDAASLNQMLAELTRAFGDFINQ